jgi:hypothetical protein
LLVTGAELPASGANPFADVGFREWYARYFAFAAERDWLNGYSVSALPPFPTLIMQRFTTGQEVEDLGVILATFGHLDPQYIGETYSIEYVRAISFIQQEAGFAITNGTWGSDTQGYYFNTYYSTYPSDQRIADPAGLLTFEAYSKMYKNAFGTDFLPPGFRFFGPHYVMKRGDVLRNVEIFVESYNKFSELEFNIGDDFVGDGFVPSPGPEGETDEDRRLREYLEWEQWERQRLKRESERRQREGG